MAEGVEYGCSGKCDDDDRNHHCRSDRFGFQSFDITVSGWQLSVCVGRSDSGVGRTVCLSTKTLTEVGEGEPWPDVTEYRSEFGAIGVLVRAVGTRAIRTRSVQWSGFRIQFADLLSLGDDYTECADSRSRNSRGVGNRGVRNGKCRLGGCTTLGHKYLATMLSLALP